MKAESLNPIITKINKYLIFSLISEKTSFKKKTPIVLVHGLSVSSKYMIPTAKELSNYFNVYAADLPGYGKSTKSNRILTIKELTDVLFKWMLEMKIKKAILLGNSLGCQIIIDFAIRYPKQITKAILIGPTMDATHKSLVSHIFGLIIDTFREPASSFAPIFSDYIKAGLRRTIKTAEMALKDPIKKKLPLVKVPVLIVRGERDAIISQEWVETINTLLPNSRLIVIKNAAHAVNFNSPKKLVQAIRKFLKKT